LFPPQPLVPEKQFVASELLKGGNVPDAKIKYQEYLRKDIDTTQNGLVIQRSTGRAFEMPDPTPASVPFLSLQGEPFPTTKFFARKLDALTQANDNEGRIALENKIRGIGQRPPAPTAPLQVTPMPAATGMVNAPRVATITTPRPAETVPENLSRSALPSAALPVAPPPAAPGMKTPAQLAKEKAEEEQRRAIAQATAIKQAEVDITKKAETEKENKEDERKTLVDIKKAGRNQVNIADQYAKLITQYPNAIGTAAKPGFLSAGIKLLESGATIGGENAKVSALQEAVATLTGTPEELSARRVMMGLAAEYLFTLRSLAKGQGSITDYETRVLSSIGPSIEDDPKTARFKAAIIKMHGEAEIDRANEYNEWKKRNQGIGWKDYLGSKEHDKFATKYDQDLARAYDIYLGRKPQQTSAQPSKPASNPALDFARSLK
jgi:hypothetical protein